MQVVQGKILGAGPKFMLKIVSLPSMLQKKLQMARSPVDVAVTCLLQAAKYVYLLLVIDSISVCRKSSRIILKFLRVTKFKHQARESGLFANVL